MEGNRVKLFIALILPGLVAGACGSTGVRPGQPTPDSGAVAAEGAGAREPAAARGGDPAGAGARAGGRESEAESRTAAADVLETRTGVASYYADALHGRLTASGVRYDRNALVAAHRSYPFGTVLRVTNLENRRSVTVRVVDRGPFIEGRILDLSRRAAERLGFIPQGLTRVRIEVLAFGSDGGGGP